MAVFISLRFRASCSQEVAQEISSDRQDNHGGEPVHSTEVEPHAILSFTNAYLGLGCATVRLTHFSSRHSKPTAGPHFESGPRRPPHPRRLYRSAQAAGSLSRQVRDSCSAAKTISNQSPGRQRRAALRHCEAKRLGELEIDGSLDFCNSDARGRELLSDHQGRGNQGGMRRRSLLYWMPAILAYRRSTKRSGAGRGSFQIPYWPCSAIIALSAFMSISPCRGSTWFLSSQT
jgi:hypothetical protein